MVFDEIVLSKDEMDLLKALAREGAILVVNEIRDAVRRLEHFGLAQTEVVTNPAFIAEAHKKSGDILPKAAEITDTGRDYLAYLEEKEADSRRDFRRDVLLAFIGAVIGSIVTLLFERLPLLVKSLKSILQLWGE